MTEEVAVREDGTGQEDALPAPPSRSKPLVAIVGRPNVGKSTLVNRIIGRREAIVEEKPGVTRDRKFLEAEWAGREFTIVDTGGWLETKDTLEGQVSAQSERAVRAADVVVMVADADTFALLHSYENR